MFESNRNHAVAVTGVNLGTLGDNLPPAGEMVGLCHQHNIGRIRLFNPNPAILQALQGSSMEVIVGVPNEELPAIAQDPGAAKTWVEQHILAYGRVNFKYIAAGNEVSLSNRVNGQVAASVGPAIENIHNALGAAGLGNKVKVTTVVGMWVLGNSYPPSAGSFREDTGPFINPIIGLLKRFNAPLLVNVYPYLAYIGDPQGIHLDYALFTSPGVVIRDGPYNYQNLFDAMLDAVYAALEKAGAPNVEIVVSETGWPTSGGTGTSIENAQTYNNKLVEHVKGGTPRRPSRPIEAYIFDLFDEDQKSPEYEKHWGLFLPNKQQKYPLTFNKKKFINA